MGPLVRSLGLLLALAFCGSFGLVLRSDGQFELFKKQFSKVYNSPEEEELRRSIFGQNLQVIENHNAEFAKGLHSYKLGINQFADMSNDEFAALRSTIQTPNNKKANDLKASFSGKGLPEAVDWRTKGWVTPVINQGQCGSAWAFNSIGCMEGQHMNATGKLERLSVRQISDCQGWECNGIFYTSDAFEYAVENGMMSAEDYPATQDRKCHYNQTKVVATFSDYAWVSRGSEAALQEAVANIGPVAVTVDASQFSFQLYTGGIYDPPNCSDFNLDHGMLVVGYGSNQDGKDYWIVKNSWGASWGQNGYILMARNEGNKCGIASDAMYILT